MNNETFFELISRIRQKLLERGTNTLSTLPKVYRSFESCDLTASKVAAGDFFWGLENYGIVLRKEEANILISMFDKDNDSCIYFDDFLYAMRSKPNADRQKVIDLVYYKFDKARTGYADPNELRKVFNCVRHPRFLTGELNEDQIFYLFLQFY